jgi:hypothetical protein
MDPAVSAVAKVSLDVEAYDEDLQFGLMTPLVG